MGLEARVSEEKKEVEKLISSIDARLSRRKAIFLSGLAIAASVFLFYERDIFIPYFESLWQREQNNMEINVKREGGVKDGETLYESDRCRIILRYPKD